MMTFGVAKVTLKKQKYVLMDFHFIFQLLFFSPLKGQMLRINLRL